MNKLAKQSLAALTALSLVTLPTMTEAASKTIQINIDGAKQTYDVQPYIKNSRTLVPLRGIFEKLGAAVYWDNSTQSLLAVKGQTVINLKIGVEVSDDQWPSSRTRPSRGNFQFPHDGAFALCLRSTWVLMCCGTMRRMRLTSNRVPTR